VLLVELLDDLAHLGALVGQPDAHRAAVDARALVVEPISTSFFKL
jgi:hypothetical protein